VPELKIGIQLKSLRLPFRQALETARNLGAAAVEIDARHELQPQHMTGTALRQVRKVLDDLNLRVCAVAYPTRRGYDVEEDLTRRVEGTKAAMRLAHDLGANVVINQVGRVPCDSSERSWQLLVEVLSDLERYGEHIGALLAAETGSESGPDLARLIHALPPGTTGVNFDPGNLIINGFSASESLEALGPHVLHVHAKDGVRDLAIGRGVEVPLGRGSADFPALLGRLEEHGYRGYFTIERSGGSDPIGEIAQAVKYLRSL
jgi:sugar phosphate isomerase/epimerase